MTSGYNKFKRLIGQASATLGTADPCSIPPFFFPSLSPYDAVWKNFPAVVWLKETPMAMWFQILLGLIRSCLIKWIMNTSGLLSSTGQHLRGYSTVGPWCAAMARRDGRRTTATPQLVLWKNTRLRRLMPPTLVSWALDLITWRAYSMLKI